MGTVVQHFAQYKVASARPKHRRRAQGAAPRTPLDDLPSIFEVEETIKSMSNRKSVGPEELPAELLILALDEDRHGNRRILE